MRAIFIFLLISNTIFFGYQYLDKNITAEKSAPVDAHKNNASSDARGLQLLGERGEIPKLPMSKKNPDSSGEKTDAEFCTMIGPYGQLLQAEYALEHLASLGVGAHITPVEIKEGELYWVYLPAEMSEREALRRLYELQAKGIESHVIAKGELANGISFGRFADYEQAEAKVHQIKDLGYEGHIKMLPKIIQETWLVVEPGFEEKIDEIVWANLLSKEQHLEKRQNFCLGVDSR